MNLLLVWELLLRFGPLMLLFGWVAYLLWDKRRALVLAWDPETDKVYPKKALIKDDGVRINVPGLPGKVCKPRVSLKGEWQGYIFTRPVLVVNARTGNQMGTLSVHDSPEQIERVYHQMHATADLTEEERQAGNPSLVSLAEIAWPLHYCQAIDGAHAGQLNPSKAQRWLLAAVAIVGILALANVFYMAGGG